MSVAGVVLSCGVERGRTELASASPLLPLLLLLRLRLRLRLSESLMRSATDAVRGVPERVLAEPARPLGLLAAPSASVDTVLAVLETARFGCFACAPRTDRRESSDDTMRRERPEAVERMLSTTDAVSLPWTPRARSSAAPPP